MKAHNAEELFEFILNEYQDTWSNLAKEAKDFVSSR